MEENCPNRGDNERGKWKTFISGKGKRRLRSTHQKGVNEESEI